MRSSPIAARISEVGEVKWFTPISKFKSIHDNYPSYGLVNNQFRINGFITLFNKSFEKEIEQDNLNLITSSSTNSLKKFISLLDMYKQWINLFRKMHEEC